MKAVFSFILALSLAACSQNPTKQEKQATDILIGVLATGAAVAWMQSESNCENVGGKK